MAEPAKYLFDRNLKIAAPMAETPEMIVERQLRQEFEQELVKVRKSEYDRGFRHGLAEAQSSTEVELAKAVAQLVEASGWILDTLDEECSAIRSHGVDVAIAASRCLASGLIEREPAAQIETLFAQCLEHLGDAPHIAVTVHDSLAEMLQDRIATLSAQQGFAGKIIVLGDPETERGDCRIEWADGGIARNFKSLNAEIEKVVKDHLAGPRAEEQTPGPAGTPAAPDNTADQSATKPAQNPGEPR